MRCALVAALLLCVAAALPQSPWLPVKRSQKLRSLEFNLALFQQNQQQLFDKIYEVADPDSPTYSQWLSIEEINAIVSPSEEFKHNITVMLRQHNITVLSDHGDFFRVSASVPVIERVFSTQVWEFQHRKFPSKRLTRANRITIPAWMQNHVEMVAGLTELPRSTLRPKRALKTLPGNEMIIPEFLRLLYNISKDANVEGQNSSMCVAEFQDDTTYLTSDMKLFYKEMAEPAYKIKDVGPFSDNPGPDAESTLDIQFGGAISRGAQQWFWVDQTWMLSFSQQLYSTPDAPLVVSMSWGWPENGQCESGIGSCTDPQQYVQRCNTEFAKIVARGITLVAASGDQGAPGDNNPGCNSGLSDLFPASSPWVLAVGATQLGTNATNLGSLATPVTAPICHTPGISCARGDILEEQVCSYPTSLITSGGGFSTYSAMPSYQKAAVAAYFAQNPPLPPSSMYNANNRAFPDVAALGHNYIIYLSGAATQVDGTSCSSPVFGAMIALLNAQRLKAGKKPLGFSHLLWYKAPAGVFRDIVTGNNFCTESCCSSTGWTAATGWDPITGRGTLNFPAASAYIAKLP